MLQSSLLCRMSFGDRFRDLRHDIDHMTYEELLELGEKIGHVCTGLNEEQIVRCIRKLKHSVDVASHFSCVNERKCSICQEEYEVKDAMGTLKCGHKFHVYCIKQWLLRKNACPFCKSAAYQHGHSARKSNNNFPSSSLIDQFMQAGPYSSGNWSSAVGFDSLRRLQHETE